jgi:hypothetical protein
MKKLLVVLEREYMERVRTRWFLVATVFGPVFFGLLMFLPAWISTRTNASADVARIRVLDATDANLGHLVAVELGGGVFGDTTLTQVQLVRQEAIAEAESTATRDIRRKAIKGYLVLDAGTLDGRGSRYAGTNASALADMRRIENAISRELIGLELKRAGISTVEADRVKRLRAGLRSERITLTGRGGSGRVNVLFASIVGILLYMTILMYGQNVLRGVIEEKQSRVAEVVVSSVRPTTLLAGKVLGVGAVGLTQMAIWLFTTIVMFRYRYPDLSRPGSRGNTDPSAERHRAADPHAAGLLPAWVHALFGALRRRRRDGEQRAGSAAGADAGRPHAGRLDHVSPAGAARARRPARHHARPAPHFVADHDAAADEHRRCADVGDRPVDAGAGRGLLPGGVFRGDGVSHRAIDAREARHVPRSVPVDQGSLNEI